MDEGARMEPKARRAGFVLAGGNSSRLGMDKAMLPYAGATLIEHVAASVRQAAGSAVIVGRPERYGSLGYPCLPDSEPGRGPLKGIGTALTATEAAWNLIVACDMPGVTPAFLSDLLEAADDCSGDCLVPVWGGGMIEPLCAAYSRRCGPVFREALRNGCFAVRDAIVSTKVAYWRVEDPGYFRNVNYPEDIPAHSPLPAAPSRNRRR